MGQFMREYDVLIPALFELLNLRFAPLQGDEPEWFGGIAEVAAMQREFAIFREGRMFHQSVALLGLGGQSHPQARNRWFGLLEDLKSYPSNQPGMTGDVAIVDAIVADLAQATPLPLYFKAHDSRLPNARRVIIGEEPRPLFYVEQDYLTISLPMRPKTRA